MKYVFRAFFADEQLFNLTADPWEMRNLAPLAATDSGINTTLALWRHRMVVQFEKEGRGPHWVANGALQRRTDVQTYSPNYPHPPLPSAGDGVFAFGCNRNGQDGYVQSENQVMNATEVATAVSSGSSGGSDPVIKLTLNSEPNLCLTVSSDQPAPNGTLEMRFDTCGGTGALRGAAPLPTQLFVHESNGGQTGPVRVAGAAHSDQVPQGCVSPLFDVSGEDVRVVLAPCSGNADGAARSTSSDWQSWVFGASGYFFVAKDGMCMSSVRPTWGAMGRGAGQPWSAGDPLPAP